MPDLCTDNRFELIDKYRQRLIEATNIETSQDEMEVLDSILFRFWQMGWLDRLEEEKHGRWVSWKWYTSKNHDSWTDEWKCSECGYQFAEKDWCYCPNCGARMDGDEE